MPIRQFELTSAAKRLSMMQFAGEGFSSETIIPDGTIGQADRQALLWGYSGILWAEPSLATGVVCIRMTGAGPYIDFSGNGPSIRFSGAGPYIDFSGSGCGG